MENEKIIVPPIKIQGIKTKLVPFIREHVVRDPDGMWIEPFLGSGVVAFNIAPRRALLTDRNEHTIRFYQYVQDGLITADTVREYLTVHGEMLRKEGEAYYREMRKEFNETHDPLCFLFLNRADFNGMIRFNRDGNFNVPFCKKPDRFAKAYVTKISNQVKHVSEVMDGKDWTFVCCPWQTSIREAVEGDYVYLDPPYTGRDTSYIGEWPESEAVELSKAAHQCRSQVGLSMWKENEFRRNDYLFKYWDDFTWYDTEHFYHVGASEQNRHPMIEVFAVKP